MKRMQICVAVAATVVGLSAMSMAKQTPMLSAMDKQFMEDGAEGSIAEIRYARVVLKRAAGASARQFAQMMIRDHSKALLELQMLARQKGVALPNDTSEKEKVVIARIAQEKGVRLDAAYKDEMIRDHVEDIGNAQREISLGRDPQVKAAAQKSLLLFQHHLQMARMIQTGTIATARITG